MITAPLPRASPSGTGRLSMIIPRYYGLTITYSAKILLQWCIVAKSSTAIHPVTS